MKLYFGTQFLEVQSIDATYRGGYFYLSAILNKAYAPAELYQLFSTENILSHCTVVNEQQQAIYTTSDLKSVREIRTTWNANMATTQIIFSSSEDGLEPGFMA